MPHLIARTMPVSSLEPSLRREAYALFAESYDGTSPDRFERDLDEKQTIILLFDPATRRLRGFSTVLIQPMPEGRGTVVFSGDTVIHRDYWGQKQLQIAFARLLLREKLRAPHRPLYWFLVSKGYRTYLLLANAFPRAVPRRDRPDEPALRDALETLARRRFGADYDAARGIVRFVTPHERVREGLAPITPRHLENPHVCFFVARNPGHAGGDELACLAEVRFVDIARIAGRIAGALMRRAVGAPGPSTAGRPQPGAVRPRRWDVRGAEGS